MAKGQRRVAEAKSPIVAKLPRACSDEMAAVEFLEELRWGGEPSCPRCGDTAVRQIRNQQGERSRYLWRCHGCRKQFTVRIGTVFEDSRIPLRHWCYAFWAACSSKKGVSAMQIKRQTGVSYKSALFLMHRIRYAMAEDAPAAPPLNGTVEVDETFVGGKPRYRGPHNPRGHSGKQPVMGMVERGGRLRTRVVPNVTAHTLQNEVRRYVDRKARLITDENAAYVGLGSEFEGGHDAIKHKNRQYVDGDITTNTIESFFAILKRGIYGTFHAVSRQHLHRYLSEFEFRYNTRGMDDGERVALAIQGAEGKRLMYRMPRAA
jgi:transposase-like protein